MKYLFLSLLIVPSTSYTNDDFEREFYAQQVQTAYQDAYTWYQKAELASSTAQNHTATLARIAKQLQRIRVHAQALLNNLHIQPSEKAHALCALEHANRAQEQVDNAEKEILDTCYNKASAHTYYLQAVNQSSTPAYATALNLTIQHSNHACNTVLLAQTTIAKALEYTFLANQAYRVIKHTKL